MTIARKGSRRIVVERAIRRALAAGWRPRANGSPRLLAMSVDDQPGASGTIAP